MSICFAHSVLVLIALSNSAFYFVNGLITHEHGAVGFMIDGPKFLLILHIFEALIIVHVDRF